MIKSPEELRRELVDAVMSRDDALQESKMLSDHAKATLRAGVIAAHNAIIAAESR
jgi:hypothetical protein